MRQLRPHFRGPRYRMASHCLFPADALPQVWQPPHHAKIPALLYGKRGIQKDLGRDGEITTKNIKIMNENKQLPSVVGPWVIMALCLLYGVSPVDIIPDIPIVGQIDDLIILASGSLNLAQRYMERADSSLTSIVKVTKWIVIALGAIVILLLALFAVAIVNLFK